MLCPDIVALLFLSLFVCLSVSFVGGSQDFDVSLLPEDDKGVQRKVGKESHSNAYDFR